ncbi:MAG: hypothetical protein MI867_10660, partial [Pseudomonadales bacterium]|nr:hypothetical protein [Pseudomonadales bacterium]
PVNIILTYWHLGSSRKYEKSETLNYHELKAYSQGILDKFLEWIDIIHAHRLARDKSIAGLEFPFTTYREGQKGLAGACYKAVEQRRTTFIHAATGIGKSIGTLFGTLKAIPDSPIEHIWYLTAKTSGKSAINQAVNHLTEQGCQLKVLHLYNRGSSCFCDPPSFLDNNQLDQEDISPCEWSARFYSQWHAAMKALLEHAIIDLSLLQAVANEYQICPYQLAHAMIPWVDIVVADFNFVFSHTNRNNQFIDNRGKSVALLVDEAHNLANRCRELYKASLRNHDLQLLTSLIDSASPKIKRSINQLKKIIQQANHDQKDSPNDLISQLEATKSALEEWQQQQAQLFPSPELLEFKININQWLRLSRYLESGLGASQGAHFSLFKSKANLELLNNCPAPVIDDLIKNFRSCVYFSGSLLPIAYFIEQLTLQSQQDCTTLVIESPFSPDHLDIYIG